MRLKKEEEAKAAEEKFKKLLEQELQAKADAEGKNFMPVQEALTTKRKFPVDFQFIQSNPDLIFM